MAKTAVPLTSVSRFGRPVTVTTGGKLGVPVTMVAERGEPVVFVERGGQPVELTEPWTGNLAETRAYVAAMTVPPSAPHIAAIDDLIGGLKDAGLWSLVKLMRLPMATEQATLRDVKNPSLTGVNFGCTFTPYEGFTSDGISQYVALGTTFAALGIAQNSLSAAVWVTGGPDVANANGRALGMIEAIGAFTFVPRGTTQISVRLNSTTSTSVGAVSTTMGHTLATRRGATDVEGYRNGVSAGTASGASTGVATGSLAMFRGATAYVAMRIPYCAILDGMTTPQVTAYHALIARALRALGASI